MNCTECEKPAIARGLCTLHYQRFRKSEDWSRVQPDAGERVGTSKLTESDVIEIRNSRGKETQVSLAARFGVSQSLISAIQTNQWWKHVSS